VDGHTRPIRRRVARDRPLDDRTGSLPRTALIVFQAALSLVLLSAARLLAALYGLEHQAFGFGRTIARWCSQSAPCRIRRTS
jgi:hypothetical protein